MRSSAEGGVGGAAFGDLGFEPVPDCQQLLLVTMFSPRFSKWYSSTWVSTIESTGHDSSQNPQKMHVNRSVSERVGRRVPSARCSEWMVIASAGQTASHSLQAMQRSSPLG